MNHDGDQTEPGTAVKFKIYRMKDFLRFTETGEVDIDRSKEIVRRLAMASSFHEDHNILLDMRDTYLRDASMARVMEVALEFARYKSAFRGKVANLLPDDEERIRTANQLKDLMTFTHEFNYEIFTSFEEAIEWLSDVKHYPGKVERG